MSQTQQTKRPTPPISLRLTEAERDTLERAAKGMTLSAYVRDRLFGDDVAPRKTRNLAPVKDQEALARMLGLLGSSRIANNLNQLARDANCGALIVDDAVEQQINEAYQHIQSMRAELLRALGLIEENKQ